MEEDLEVVTGLHGVVRDSGWRGLSPNIFRLISRVASGAVTGFFALAGAFLGVLCGALAGRASDTGIIRGAALGAIAGAVLGIEVLEAYHAYWRSDQSNSQNTYDVGRLRTEFVEDLFYDRFVPHQFSSARLLAYHWQLEPSITSSHHHHQVRDISGDVQSKGLSGDLLIKLPSYVIPHNKSDGHEESICCTICLQVLTSMTEGGGARRPVGGGSGRRCGGRQPETGGDRRRRLRPEVAVGRYRRRAVATAASLYIGQCI